MEENKLRVGIVVSATRFLFGVDYDNKLLALYLGPIAFCLAWGSPGTNPFTSPESFQKWQQEQQDNQDQDQ